MPTLYRTLPGSTIYFTLLNGIQTAFETIIPAHHDPWRQSYVDAQNLISGATARGLAGAVLNPVTVVKARYEVHIVKQSTNQPIFLSCIIYTKC